jgi:hypothetical protein
MSTCKHSLYLELMYLSLISIIDLFNNFKITFPLGVHEIQQLNNFKYYTNVFIYSLTLISVITSKQFNRVFTQYF